MLKRTLCWIPVLLLATTAHATNSYLLNGSGPFGTLDLGTGAFSNINSATGGVNEIGLGEFNGLLYLEANGLGGSELNSVDPATGNNTPIGAGLPLGDDFGSTANGLFLVGTDANLYSVDPSSGAETKIGALGITLSGFRGLSVSIDSTALFFSDGGNLYTIDTTTGSATLVGQTIDGSSADQSYGGLMFLSGTLYGASQNNQIDTIDPATANVLTETNITCGGCTIEPFGLAPIIPTPEPGTLALWAGGIMVLLLLRSKVRPRRQKLMKLRRVKSRFRFRPTRTPG